MYKKTTQTGDSGRLTFIWFRAEGLQTRLLTLLTQHILNRVDFSTVKATPGGRT